MGTFPERVLAPVNAALTSLFDLLAAPAIGAAPLTTLILLSAATGLVMLWVVGRTSNQAGISAAKRRIQAGLFEIRLFNDNLGAVLRALGRVLWQNLRYLGYSLVPLAWVALPLTLVIAQLQAFYGYEGLVPGQPALLVLRLSDPRAIPAALSLDADRTIRIETAAVVLPGSSEVLWRVVPTEPGDYTLVVHVSGMPQSKSLHVSGGAARRSPYRVGTGFLDILLYPSEAPLPGGGPVREMALRYPETGLNVLGWRVHWLIVYVVVSMATAFGFAKRFGVEL